MAETPALTAYHRAEVAYASRNPTSKSLHDQATEVLPGGNTRSVLFHSPFPLSIIKAEGARLYDADGHEYVDLLGEYTAGLYGHSHPTILATIAATLSKGLNYGGQHADEAHLARLIRARYPSIELLRFTNSGTEATLMALALAKAFTSREKILVFNGAYHGGAFSFRNDRSGPVNVPHDYLIARYNDVDSVREAVRDPAVAANVAAIVLEPMTGSGGAIPATREFLLAMRLIATEIGALLIFDEVMTSRLYSGSGVQSQLPLDHKPDLTMLGKYIGGGMSFGAFGGRSDIMSMFDPRRDNALAHAGTFNNNVLTMAVGRAGLEKVFTSEIALEQHAIGEAFRRRLEEVGKDTIFEVTGCGTILCIHFTHTPAAEVRSVSDLADEDHVLGGLLHLYLLERGFYIARRGFMALNLALTSDDLGRFVEVVSDFIAEHENLLTKKA